MNKNLLRCGVLAGLLILLLLVAGAAWWFFMGQFTMAAVPPASPVQVFLLSPSSGDDVAAGDLVLVDLQAVAPTAISWSEVFVDGTSLGALTELPERTSWTWQAWPAGIHVLSGRAQASDGQLGESQTVIVNVIATDETMEVQAAPSETLEQVGAKFGVPPAQMAAANPDLDPAKPLQDAPPVKVPTGGGGAGGPQPPGGEANAPGAGNIPFLIQWDLKLTGPADKSYCYISDGSGTWDKMPKQPFQFFGGLDNLYTQVFDATPPSAATIQAQCWGWLGGVLKYLGQGATKPIGSGPIQLIGEGFELTGLPKWPEGSEVPTVDLTYTVPPPFALRTPKNAADCTAHAAPIVGPFICDTLMGAAKSQYVLLEWEWQPGVSVPGGEVAINDIAGYMLYEIIPDTGAPPQYLKSVKPLGAKAAAVPVPWEKRCYGVRAFADNPKYGGTQVSEMATYCPGEPPATIMLEADPPLFWLTTGQLAESWYDDFGAPPEAVIVGADKYIKEYRASAAVKFGDHMPHPPGGVLQKALFKFDILSTKYSNSDWGSNMKPLCIASVGVAQKEWIALNGGGNHYLAGANTLASSAYNAPIWPLPEYKWPPIQIDVTSAVKDWSKDNFKYHGFILAPRPASQGTTACWSVVGNFRLELYYFAP